MPTATAEPKTKTVVTPFVVEADVPNNGDLLLQSILGCRLRSAIDPSRTVTDTATGREMIPKDPSRHLGMLPSVPGMRLHVNPAKLTYTITDPLHDDEGMCEAIRLALNADERPVRSQKITGVPPQDGTLDEHRMKTLCRELIWLLDSNHAKIVGGGSQPRKADVDRLPGHYLLNPGSLVHNLQPRFEKDWPAYIERLSVSGG